MTIEQELESIDAALAVLEFNAIDDGTLGEKLPGRHAATLNRLRVEAKTILDHALGLLNNFSMALGMLRSPANSLAAVQECRSLIQGAVNHLRRRGGISAQPSRNIGVQHFVDISRLAELRAVKSAQWDLTRLNRLCEELNTAYANDCYTSVALLLRAIVDHVPPLFEARTFVEVANNYSGSSSFKRSMQTLQQSLRNIADAHLHNPIRQQEVLPTERQIDFRQDLDVLLGEIARKLK